MHENSAGGASVKYQCHQVLDGGNVPRNSNQKQLVGLCHGVHVYVCVSVCIDIIAAAYVMASRCTALQIQELDHLCSTINRMVLSACVCVCVLAILVLWFSGFHTS